MKNPPQYTIEVYGSAAKKQEHAADINAYYALRAKTYVNKWGKDQEKYYANYPTEQDARPDTIFLVFKGTDPESGLPVVFGGRRIVFQDKGQIGTLPLEGKHTVKGESGLQGLEQRSKGMKKRTRGIRTEGFKAFVTGTKSAIDITDIVPGVATDPTIRCVEVGAFAIDKDIFKRIAPESSESDKMFAEVYAKTLTAAADAGADIAIVAAGGLKRAKGDRPEQRYGNLQNQMDWLQTSPYKFRRLNGTVDLFDNPLPHPNETEMLLVNVGSRNLLTGHGNALRYNQAAAKAGRG